MSSMSTTWCCTCSASIVWRLNTMSPCICSTSLIYVLTLTFQKNISYFLFFEVSKYHVVQLFGHDCRSENLNLFKFIFCPIILPKCLVVLYKIVKHLYLYFHHNIQTHFVRWCPFYETSCVATIKKWSLRDFYVGIHSKTGSWILYQFARTYGSSKQVCNSLSNLEKNNLFNGWYVVTTFGYHVVWYQKNNEYQVISTNIYFDYECHTVIVTFCWKLAWFSLGGQCCACKFWLNHLLRPLQSVFHDRYMS